MSDKTKIVGVTYDNRQSTIKEINEVLDYLIAVREPENPHDPNAINIHVKKYNGETKSIGYVNRGLAADLSKQIDAGKELVIQDFVVLGDPTKKHNLGVLIDYMLVDK